MSIELRFIFARIEQVIQTQRRNLHNVSNIQICNQFRLIQIPQNDAHVRVDLSKVRVLLCVGLNINTCFWHHPFNNFFKNRLYSLSRLFNKTQRLFQIVMSSDSHRCWSIIRNILGEVDIIEDSSSFGLILIWIFICWFVALSRLLFDKLLFLNIVVAERMHVLNQQMGQLHTFLRLLQSVHMVMQLWEQGTELHSNLGLELHSLHSLRYRLVIQGPISINKVQGVLEGNRALFQRAQLLVAHSHVDKHYEAEVLVSWAPVQIDHVHDAMGLLK